MGSIYRQTKQSSMAAIALTMLTVLFSVTARSTQAQTYTPLYAFGAIDSTQNGPIGQLALGRDGNFYGIVNPGLAEIYKITPEGGETLLWSAGTEGSTVCSGLTLGADGLLYGTCQEWDSYTSNAGIIFKFDPSKGQSGFTTLYTFPYCGGSWFPNPLTLGSDGNLYGTTGYGQCGGDSNYGTFFKITPSGTFTMLHTFQGYAGNDAGDPSGALTLAANGNFYGTSQFGGNIGQNGGTLYEVTTKGKVTLLYSFTNSYEPFAGMTQGADGKFYGTTWEGGTYGEGTIFQLSGKKIKILHNFEQSPDNAAFPSFSLTLGADGNFYSPSLDAAGGGYGPESLFEITTGKKSVYTDLFNLAPGGCSDATQDGCMMSSPMFLHPNGIFYGTTEQGGVYQGEDIGRGVFYSFNTGFKPYIILQYPQGTIGKTIGIFGVGLTGTTAVDFDGVAANFTVVSDTYLTATIPTGATTGYVTVTTPSETLKSAVKLTVKK